MTGTEQQQIGVLTAKVENLEKTVAEQGVMLREVRDVITSTKGSWKVLVILGGLLVTLSSIATSLVIKFWPGH